MNYLISKMVLIFLILNIVSCSTKFKSKILKNGQVEIIANSNRFLPVCERIDDERYGFTVQILDDQNTVMTALGMMTNLEQCNEWKNKINKILANDDKTSIVGMGDINEKRSIDPSVKYYFKDFGHYYSNERVIQADKIYNKNKCFAFYDQSCEEAI